MRLHSSSQINRSQNCSWRLKSNPVATVLCDAKYVSSSKITVNGGRGTVGSFTSLHSCSCDVQVHVTQPGHVRSSAAMRLKAHTQWTLHMKRQGRICGSRRFCLTRLTLPPVLKHDTSLSWVHMTPLTHQQGFALSIMATLSCTNTVESESSAGDIC